MKASLILILSALFTRVASNAELNTYIVQMRQPSEGDKLHRRTLMHASLESVAADPNAVLLYTYENTMNGFAAQLTDDQVEALLSQPDILSVRPDKVHQLYTTRTPAFLGLPENPYPDFPTPLNKMYDIAESDIIIGVVDSGTWPESPSYHDTHMPPVPRRWRGACEEGDQFTAKNCNRKLIGARSFYKGYLAHVMDGSRSRILPPIATGEFLSPRDKIGHGTHTSTIAAGSAVDGASLFGHAAGTARGVASRARVAMYKVCWAMAGCFDSDMLAGLDGAIEDGVDVINLSLGPSLGPFQPEPPLDETDALIVGSFAAMERGIFVAAAAGNDGPRPGRVTNLAPWMLTVAASTLDRGFPAYVTLGNGRNYTGVSLYGRSSAPGMKILADREVLPLTTGALASKQNASYAATYCFPNTLDPEEVAGKIVVCKKGRDAGISKGEAVAAAGGRGMVLVNGKEDKLEPAPHLAPAVNLVFADGSEVETYAATENATVEFVFEGTRLGAPAPMMADFSSRGPNVPVPGLLKPDITGPGVKILAGWADTSPTTAHTDARRVDFNLESGTSMSCPHLAGVAALVMARRPRWSAAAVRSAIMTTAYTTIKGTEEPILDMVNYQPATPFDYGNGHVNPVAALDPGLVYDVTTEDYIDFLCAVNTTSEFITGITRGNFTCDPDRKYSVYDLNYPSFSAVYDPKTAVDGTYTATFRRTVTNVGGRGTYKVNVSLADPDLVKVSVEPDTLKFNLIGEKKNYVVTATMGAPPESAKGKGDVASWGRLTWSNGKHRVESSMAFMWMRRDAEFYV